MKHINDNWTKKENISKLETEISHSSLSLALVGLPLYFLFCVVINYCRLGYIFLAITIPTQNYPELPSRKSMHPSVFNFQLIGWTIGRWYGKAFNGQCFYMIWQKITIYYFIYACDANPLEVVWCGGWGVFSISHDEVCGSYAVRMYSILFIAFKWMHLFNSNYDAKKRFIYVHSISSQDLFQHPTIFYIYIYIYNKLVHISCTIS